MLWLCSLSLSLSLPLLWGGASSLVLPRKKESFIITCSSLASWWCQLSFFLFFETNARKNNWAPFRLHTLFPPSSSSRAKKTTTIFGRRRRGCCCCFWDERNTTAADDDDEGRGGGKNGSKNDTNEAKASERGGRRGGRILMATRDESSEYF